MRRRFATLDVFTERRFAGNPLAVVLEAQDLDTAAMQATVGGAAAVVTEGVIEA